MAKGAPATIPGKLQPLSSGRRRSRSRRRIVATTVVIAAATLSAGCASGAGGLDTRPTSPMPGPMSGAAGHHRGPATGPAGPAGETGACANVDVAGNSRNPRLQALVTGAFNDLRCDGSLPQQLRTLSEDPGFVVHVRAGGWEKTYREALGGATLSVVDKDQTTMCMILVVPDPESKSLTCADV